MKQYIRVTTKQFRKDLRRLVKAGNDLKKLGRVIDMLAADTALPSECRDHALTGEMKGTRECHIAPDWLLRYAKDDGRLILILISTGDHRRVLGTE